VYIIYITNNLANLTHLGVIGSFSLQYLICTRPNRSLMTAVHQLLPLLRTRVDAGVLELEMID